MSELQSPDEEVPGVESSGEIVALAQSLVRLDTSNPPGRELAAASLIAERLDDAGIAVQVQRFAPDRANLMARLSGRGEQAGLMLSGHLDTVPVDELAWTVPPWDGLIRDGRLYGRGALDMKGSVAAMIVAFERLHRAGATPAGDVVLALTAGEEQDSVGARALSSSGLLEGVEMAVIGEPTDLAVGIAHRGALWVRVDAAGSSAHGSQPDAGVNAVRALLDWLHPIASIEALANGLDPAHGAGSVSLNVIGGGRAPNMIPDQAHAVLDIRTVAGHDHLAILRALRHRGEGVELTVLRDAPPIAIGAESRLAAAGLAALAECGVHARVRRMPYVTDGSVFAGELGIQAIVVGPGTETDAHTADESIALSDLMTASRVYESITRRLLYA
jgi:succinyl-diaminopimelate desuccinylase